MTHSALDTGPARLAGGVSACGTTMTTNYFNIQFYEQRLPDMHPISA